LPDMSLLCELDTYGHEQVNVCRDPRVGYAGIIAIHSTVLGPAMGGTRLWRYQSFDAAMTDALRLSRGMTYKNAIVAGLATGFGDPSPYTARGVLKAMQAAAHTLWGTDSLEQRRVAIQGMGNVGGHLALELHARGARLTVCDVDSARTSHADATCRARVVEPERIYDVDCDIFAPCALGGILNDDTIPRVKAVAVVGGANNQLLEPRHGEALASRGVLYVPDYIANAGGVISGGVDLGVWDRAGMASALDGIYDTVLKVLARSREWNVAPHVSADRLAEERITLGLRRS
jgi:leucine dehydrogenase